MGEVSMVRRRWLFPAIALASVVAGSVAYLVPVNEHQAAAMPLRPVDGSPTPGEAVRQAPAPSGSGAASGLPSPGGGAGESGPAVASAPTVTRYGFEGEGLALQVHAAAGGAVATEAHGGGLAVRFPPPCAQYRDPTCPRVILETSFAANPGTGPLRYGATVRLAARETSDGENVLQKGFSHGHSQFKLQIDGTGGQPSCVLVGTFSRRIHAVTAAVSVADGQWHTVECVRSGTSLSVLVDGAASGQTTVPAGLSIVNSDPLRIGGKGLSPNNDQFHGALDDVFVSIGCAVPC